MITKTYSWFDIGYYCEAIGEDHCVHLTVYESWEGYKGQPNFKHKSCQFSSTQNPVESNSYLDGYIKWDGCASLNLPEQEHFCGREELVKFTTMLTRLYDVALELMPKNEEYLK